MRIALGCSLMLALALAGCGESADTLAPATAPDAKLCVASTCGSKTRLVTIPDAENLLFMPAGRLFVSGGVNVYEITRSGDGSFSATPLLAGSCNFTGLALRGEVLYANCFDGRLYAARLTATPQMAAIHTLGLASPNGLATGPDGELYVVNGPIATNALPAPKIVRLRLDPADPLKVMEQTDWLVLNAAQSQPNGVQVQGRMLYFSESAAPQQGRISRVAINADGSAGTPAVLATFNSIPDDFSLVGEQLLASYFSGGQIALFNAAGALVSATDAMSFESPSQVRVGQPPMFAPTDLLVTEKGLIGDNDSAVGNVLSVFKPR